MCSAELVTADDRHCTDHPVVPRPALLVILVQSHGAKLSYPIIVSVCCIYINFVLKVFPNLFICFFLSLFWSFYLIIQLYLVSSDYRYIHTFYFFIDDAKKMFQADF